jgi:hypothetical protein
MKGKPCAAVVLSAALFFSLAANAPAADLVNGNTGTPAVGQYAQWLAESKMPAPAGDIQIYPDSDMAAACDTTADSACSAPGQIWIGGWQWRAQFEHELGHQWDFQHMVADPLATTTPMLEPWQTFFEQLWGVTGVGWWVHLPHTDGGSPGEWFATAYSACAVTGPALPHPLTMWEDDFNFPGYNRPWAMGATCSLIRYVNAHPEDWETSQASSE